MKKIVILLFAVIFLIGITGNEVLAKAKPKEAKKELKTKVAKATSKAKKAKLKAPGKININKAKAKALTELNGVGPTIADRIVEYRKKNGKFKKIEDIMEVKGIGEETFKAIKKLIIL